MKSRPLSILSIGSYLLAVAEIVISSLAQILRE